TTARRAVPTPNESWSTDDARHASRRGAWNRLVGGPGVVERRRRPAAEAGARPSASAAGLDAPGAGGDGWVARAGGHAVADCCTRCGRARDGVAAAVRRREGRPRTAPARCDRQVVGGPPRPASRVE